MSNSERSQEDDSEGKSSERKESLIPIESSKNSKDSPTHTSQEKSTEDPKDSQHKTSKEKEDEITSSEGLLRLFKLWKRPLVLLLTPLVLSFLAISEKKELRCAFCLCVVGIYWVTEVIPLAVTATFPVFLFPLTGVMTCKTVAHRFLNDTNFLFIGGLIVAVAIEKCGLHKRIALSILYLVGSEPKHILLGLMLGTASLSMFISNTATTAMMIPLVQSLSKELTISFSMHLEDREALLKSCKKMSIAFALSTCIASSIGGTGTLTGTPGNLVLVGQYSDLFGPAAKVDYVTWLLVAIPLMCFILAAAWCTLTLFFLRGAPSKDERVTALMKKNYTDLPSMSYAEKSVAICFSILLVLWIFRDPGLFKGFGTLFPEGYYTDTTSAMIIAGALFALPSEKPNFCDYTRKKMEAPRLMDWASMQKRFPWDVVLLLGGGFAVADGVKDSGLALMIGSMLSAAKYFPPWLLQLLTIVITVSVTNFCSNVATATIFVPIVATLASEVETHPLNLMLPVAITSSFAFVLPVGTAPNAIVFSTGMITVANMAVHGFVLSVASIVITSLYMRTIAHLFLPLSEFPSWAHMHNLTVAHT